MYTKNDLIVLFVLKQRKIVKTRQHTCSVKSKVQTLGNTDALATSVSSVGVRTKKKRDVVVLLGRIQVENYLLGPERKDALTNTRAIHQGQLT